MQPRVINLTRAAINHDATALAALPVPALFRRAARIMTIANIAARIGLHPNTVGRWVENGKVPSAYRMDFLRILGEAVKPAKDGAEVERELDLFFTKKLTARECFADFAREARANGVNLAEFIHIEPSAGEGCFLDLLPAKRRIALDLLPRRDEIKQADFLTWNPPAEKKYVVVGNPPFGLRGHIALQFINHAAGFADIVAFILPQLFESDGKGAPMKRVDKRLSLAFSRRLPPDSFHRPDGTTTTVNTVFQVWVKGAVARVPEPTCNSFIRIYSLSDGGTPASTRNKNMIGACDVYLPSTCYAGMRAYRTFAELPNRRGYGVKILRKKREIERLLFSHDWTKTAFLSTNSAVNLRGGLIRRVVTQGGYSDE